MHQYKLYVFYTLSLGSFRLHHFRVCEKLKVGKLSKRLMFSMGFTQTLVSTFPPLDPIRPYI